MLALLLILVVTAATGCTWAQKGAAAGGVLGAAIGGPWANNSGTIGTAGGIAIGAATGGLLGAMVGSAFDAKDIKDLNEQIEKLNKELAEKDKEIQALKDEIARLNANKPVEIERIVLSNDVLFAPGKAKLTKDGKALLDKSIAYVKATYPAKKIVVEGHTDSDPIKLSRKSWTDNWDLGAGRGLAVLRYLCKQGVDGKSISAQTFGEFQPVASNDTKEGKKQNRRSVLVVMDEVKTRVEEVK
jgi:flagellar motor protein MotB